MILIKMEKAEHKYATWNIQGIFYKDEHVDDICIKKGIGIVILTERKRKLKGSKKT
jgi:hypothetical protein